MEKTILSTLVLLSCSLLATGDEPIDKKLPSPQGVRSTLDLRHREGGGVGYSQGYSTADYLLTTQGEKWELLFNLRGHLFNDGKGAGNIGLGLRTPIKEEKYLVGANLYYDCRQSSNLFANQIGAGVEWLGPHIDFRVNGYIPVGQQRDVETKLFQSFSGTNLFIKRHLKGILPSIDGEIGTPLPKHFYFAVGSYYLFEQEKAGIKMGNAWGGRIRGEVHLGQYFTLAGIVTYDKIFHTRMQGSLALNIPLGKWKRERSGKRSLRQVPIMRNEIIPLQTKQKTALLTGEDDDDLIEFLFVNNSVLFSGDGSIERPFASLKEAEKNSQPGNVIYVFAGDGTPRNMDEGIILKDKQVLASSGEEIVIENVIIPPQTPGEKPVITNIHPNEAIVTNPGNSALGAFILLAPWDYIFGNWKYEPINDVQLETKPDESWVIPPDDNSDITVESQLPPRRTDSEDDYVEVQRPPLETIGDNYVKVKRPPTTIDKDYVEIKSPPTTLGNDADYSFEEHPDDFEIITDEELPPQINGLPIPTNPRLPNGNGRQNGRR